MRLNELATKELNGKDDFKLYGFNGNIPVVNDIWYTYNSEKIKGEYFRFSDKIRFSLKIDGQEVPFATVTRSKRSVFPDSYDARVEILPCMIPQALEGLAQYMQIHPVISGDSFSKKDARPYVREIQAVQRELNNLLESTLLERKVEQSYQERRVA
tara:strand:- start:82 stop:549 length:468 start_codon:yes stop_codon:yes gene_type:complete